MPRKGIIFHTNLSVDQCVQSISELTDPATITLFSISGYKGSKPLLSKIEGRHVRIWKRIYYRNDFRPYFYGIVSPDSNGARLEGHFDMNRWARIFMAIWMGLVAISAVPFAIQFFKDAGAPDRPLDLVPIYMLAFGFVLPKFGRWMGRGEERFIVDQLEKALAARVEITDGNAPRTPPYANEPIG